MKHHKEQKQEMFQIHDCDMPNNIGRGRAQKYPFDNMDEPKNGRCKTFIVGHSDRDAINCRSSLQYYYKKHGRDKEFTVRHDGNNIYRCYRIK